MSTQVNFAFGTFCMTGGIDTKYSVLPQAKNSAERRAIPPLCEFRQCSGMAHYARQYEALESG
jgi:hypothetical protein